VLAGDDHKNGQWCPPDVDSRGSGRCDGLCMLERSSVRGRCIGDHVPVDGDQSSRVGDPEWMVRKVRQARMNNIK
jgi:hypothetical protein